MDKVKRRRRILKHRIMNFLLIMGAISMIPLTTWLVWRFNIFFLGYPAAYATWAVHYANKHGYLRSFRTKEQIDFELTHEYVGDDEVGNSLYRNKLTNEIEEY